MSDPTIDPTQGEPSPPGDATGSAPYRNGAVLRPGAPPPLTDADAPPVVSEDLDALAASLEEPRSSGNYEADAPLTDWGNAERIVRRFGPDIRYHMERGQFLVWTGVRWARDMRGVSWRMAKTTMRGMASSAATMADADEAKKVFTHAKRSENARGLKDMLMLLPKIDGVSVLSDELDRDPWLLGTPNGTVDLRDGTIREPRREDMITLSTRATFDRDATCPAFLKFLGEAQADPAIRSFLRRLAGYSLTGIVREHVFPIFFGTGRNGKGTYVDTLLYVLGEYAQQVPTELVMAKKFDAHPTEKTTLLGRRLVAASETEQGRELNVALVKAITGGDTITARHMKQDYFSFRPTHKILLSTNHRPVIRETAAAIWSRVMLVGWPVSFEGREDTTLKEVFEREGSGILNWLIDGCLEYQTEGLCPPASVTEATQVYRMDEDIFGEFLASRCHVEPIAARRSASPYRTLSGLLYAEYKAWTLENGYGLLGAKKVVQALREREFSETERAGKTTWHGVAVRAPGDDSETAAAEPEQREIVP